MKWNFNLSNFETMFFFIFLVQNKSFFLVLLWILKLLLLLALHKTDKSIRVQFLNRKIFFIYIGVDGKTYAYNCF